MIPTWEIRQGEALERLKQMPSDSVHCVVTSPPYWSLRDYRAKGQIGLEKTPDEYVARLVGLFAEVRRVLRPDGTLWLNMGDCYAQGGRGKVGDKSTLIGARWCHNEAREAMDARGESYRRPPPGLKPKDLIGLPWMLAFALRADGWYLRADIIWSKNNAMPEPVLDRPTKAHEYLFLLSKSETYFYDAAAIHEAVTGGSHPRGAGVNPKATANAGRQNESYSAAVRGLVTTRNKRSVWTVNSAPYPDAHFATYPEDLVVPCLKAGTSQRGCCEECSAPIVRQVDRTRMLDGEPAPDLGAFRNTSKGEPSSATGVSHSRVATEVRTTGWAPSCIHEVGGAKVVPCTVLDPFSGSGTTGAVALKLGRSYVGLELNPEYVEMSRRRLYDCGPMLAKEVTHDEGSRQEPERGAG